MHNMHTVRICLPQSKSEQNKEGGRDTEQSLWALVAFFRNMAMKVKKLFLIDGLLTYCEWIEHITHTTSITTILHSHSHLYPFFVNSRKRCTSKAHHCKFVYHGAADCLSVVIVTTTMMMMMTGFYALLLLRLSSILSSFSYSCSFSLSNKKKLYFVTVVQSQLQV